MRARRWGRGGGWALPASLLLLGLALSCGADEGRDIHQPFSFLPLLLIVLLAFVVPLIASRFRRIQVPIVVGEIVAGIVIGRSGLNLVRYDPWLQFLTEFGFAYLMFLSGLEVDFGLLTAFRISEGLRPRRRAAHPLTLALASFSLTLLLAVAFAQILSFAGMVRSPWMLALILSTTSLGIVMPTLKERNLLRSSFGQGVLLSALVADLATMILITAVAAVLSKGLTLEVLMGLFVLGVFLLALKVGQMLTRSPLLGKMLAELEHATAQIQVRGCLALMLLFVVLSQWLGAEVILGAFLAGVLVAAFAEREGSELLPKLEAIGYGFFIPVFFIMVGVRFDLRALLSLPGGAALTALLILSAFAIKIVSALPFRLLSSWRETLGAGILLSARLSLIIAAAEVGLRLGLITPALNSAIILVALVTCLLSPLLFVHLHLPLPRPREEVLVVGAGRLGLMLAQRLRNQGMGVTVMESDPARIESARRAGLKAIRGDATSEEDMRRVDPDRVRVVVATTGKDEVNEAACELARRLGVPERVALISDSAKAQRLREEGVRVVTPSLSTLFVLEGMVTHPLTFELLARPDADKHMVEVVLRNPSIAGRPLRKVRLPGDALILLVRRDEESIIPHGNTVLQSGDVLTLIGSEEAIREAEALLASPS